MLNIKTPHYYDTMLAEYLKNPGQRWLSLDALAKRKYKYEMKSYEDITQKKKLSFHEVELATAAKYSGEDVYITHKLYQEQKQNIKQNDKDTTYNIFYDIELPLLKILSDMEMRGMKIDRDFLKWLQGRLENAIKEIEIEIYELAWQKFNIKSPKQVWEILFWKLWLPKDKKIKTGFSVDSKVLENLAKTFPIAASISKHRHYSKLLSTYVIGLLEGIDNNNKIHTSFNQTITATWRLSSTNPNLQNIPHWDDIAWEIRKAFIPYKESDLLVAFDYSQIEIRLLAMMSKDESLLCAFRDEKDIHQLTAEFIFKKNNISSTERKFAKAVNFWVIYGISPYWLSKILNIGQKDCREYIDTFYASYPKVRTYYDNILHNARKNWYVETIFWRRRFIPAINDRNKIIANSAEREAINMPIQGSNADIIKMAMIQIQSYLDTNNCKSSMLLQVHDELIFNIIQDEKDLLLGVIPHIMENIIQDSPINLKVDIAIGKNWKECK